MKQIRKWHVGVAIGALLGTGILLAPAQATTNTAQSTILAQSTITPTTLFGHGRTLSGAPWFTLLQTFGLTDTYVVDNKFTPGETTGWHSHPGPSLIIVVAGTITNYDSDQKHCAGVSYSKGESFVDSGGSDVHTLVNRGTENAETIAVQFIPNGQPRRVDQPAEPANCHVQ